LFVGFSRSFPISFINLFIFTLKITFLKNYIYIFLLARSILMRLYNFWWRKTLFPYLSMLAQGQTQGSTLEQRTNKTLTTGPFNNTWEVDEVSPEVKAGGVVGLKCLQPSWDTDI
jgi:hypothetical protein